MRTATLSIALWGDLSEAQQAFLKAGGAFTQARLDTQDVSERDLGYFIDLGLLFVFDQAFALSTSITFIKADITHSHFEILKPSIGLQFSF